MQISDIQLLLETRIHSIVNCVESHPTLIAPIQGEFFFHECGNYWWREVSTEDDLIEDLVILWLPGSDSGIHDHGNSWNLTYLLNDSLDNSILNAYIYEESMDRLIIHEQKLDFRQYHVVTPHQKHRVYNTGTETILARHLYYPRRKND
jgi:Cysteine dioxygenase type I